MDRSPLACAPRSARSNSPRSRWARARVGSRARPRGSPRGYSESARDSRLTAARMSPRATARAPLRLQTHGLLVVVADDLGVLAGPLPEGGPQPDREPLVQLGPPPLGHGLVGGVADQDVPELEGLACQRPDRDAQQLP